MGGKSTYLRQVALNLVLAQVGCYVCAEAAALPVFTGMVARIGAGDIQSRGVSTWMAELLEVSCMLQFTSENTFLLIDELGRGTSTAEGVGMTWALAEHILQKMKCFCLFATHFFEMTKLSDRFPDAKNYHVDFKLVDKNAAPNHSTMKLEGAQPADIDLQSMLYNIKLNYKVLPGATDSAFGVQILNMMKFPEGIIRFADKLSNLQKGGMSSKMDLEPVADVGSISLDDKVEVIRLARKLAKKQNPTEVGDRIFQQLKDAVQKLTNHTADGQTSKSNKMKLEES